MHTMVAAGVVLLAVSGAVAAQAPASTNTDWLAAAGFGVFVHYLDGLQNSSDAIHSLGKQTSWDEAVREFDTERFGDSMVEAGAGYVIFTTMQVTRHLIAPNATYDRLTGYQPGEACATRDLVEDLYQSLHRRGIPLLLYYTGDGPRGDPQSQAAFGFRTPVGDAFVTKWASVAREYSERYGNKIRGWWVDGAYPSIGYQDANLAVLAEALKAGNPAAIVAFNRGVDPRVMAYTRHEDYTCGEQSRFFDMPASPFIDGERWHILSYLGPNWGQPGCRYSKGELADYVGEVHRRGGAVTIDALLFRDGSMDRSQVEVLKAVRQALAADRERPPVPPGNLAYHKQARLLSLDGSRELPVNSGTQPARLGVDGRPDTYALAGGEWAWSYAVDLVDSANVNRVKLTFAGGYPTELQVQLSADGDAWQTVASRTGQDGSPVTLTFAPVPARHVRICSVKPDGPGQPGSQMTVAELEVYADELPQP